MCFFVSDFLSPINATPSTHLPPIIQVILGICLTCFWYLSLEIECKEMRGRMFYFSVYPTRLDFLDKTQSFIYT